MHPHPSPSPAARRALAIFYRQSAGPCGGAESRLAPCPLTRRPRTAHAPAECPAAPGPRAPGGRPGRRRTVQAAARAAEHARHILQHIVRLQLVLAHKHNKHSREA